jgi:putative endonuclease
MQNSMFHVYVLELVDGSYYVGFTDKLPCRLAEHRQGIACRHTKKIPMKRVLWSELQPNRAFARKREKEIKGWRREKKERLWEGLSLP